MDTILQKPVQRTGQTLTVVLRSTLPFTAANYTWSAFAYPPLNATHTAVTGTPMALGTLQPWRYYNGEYQRQLVVLGDRMRKVRHRGGSQTQTA